MKELEVTITCKVITNEDKNTIDLNLMEYMENFGSYFQNTEIDDLDINVEDPSWMEDDD